MFAIFQKKERIKKLLFFYWLFIPIIYGTYLAVMASVQQIAVVDLLTTIPSLTVSLVIVLLQVFQAYGLYMLKDVLETRNSLVGLYLKFSLGQQLITLNFIGVFLCGFYLWLLPNEKTKVAVFPTIKIPLYLLMAFVGVLTLLLVMIRFSM